MWPIFVEFGSASSEIRRRKKKERKKERRRNTDDDDDDDEIAYFTVRWKTRASFVYRTKVAVKYKSLVI